MENKVGPMKSTADYIIIDEDFIDASINKNHQGGTWALIRQLDLIQRQ